MVFHRWLIPVCVVAVASGTLLAGASGAIAEAPITQPPSQRDLVDEYIPSEASPPAVVPSSAPALVTVNATVHGGVSGLVTDSLSQPVAGEPVEVTATSTDEEPIVSGTTTLVDGTYNLDLALPSGTYSIVAVAGGISSSAASVVVTPGLVVAASIPAVRSETPARLSVTVRDRGHIAPATVQVWIKELTSPRTLLATRLTTTGQAAFTLRPWRNPVITVTATRRAVVARVSVTGRTIGAIPTARTPRGSPVPRVPHPIVRRPIGAGALTTIQVIPAATWRLMRGLSWRPGCLSRLSLRLIETNYYGFDGYRHRGQVVVSASVAPRIRAAFIRLYAMKFRIRQMRLVDAYGRSPGGRPGANDYASMAADNTSGFNCRYVVGKESQGVRSPHAGGRSVDINPWENPYVTRSSVFPNSYFLNRRIGVHGVFRPGIPGLAAVTGVGCRWGGSFQDYHHFDC